MICDREQLLDELARAYALAALAALLAQIDVPDAKDPAQAQLVPLEQRP